MSANHAELLEELVGRGMSTEEAENFLSGKVGYVKLMLPPDSAARVLTKLNELALISKPIEVTFTVAENRIQALGDVAQEVSGRPLVNAMIPNNALVC